MELTISLCMIVRDEEAVLGRCLESVADLVEEIVILDTGSTDRTKEIAQGFTDKVFDFTWVEDFSAARNAAFRYGAGDYLMWLDADDVLEEDGREKFSAVRQAMEEGADVVMMPYHTAFDEQGRVCFSYYRERVVRNHAGFEWKGAVHEAMTPRGKIAWVDCPVCHHKVKPAQPGRNLNILERALARGETLDAREEYYYGRELMAAGRRDEAQAVLERFLRRTEGWGENKIDACRLLAECFYARKQPEKALGALLESFRYDEPRGEVCCDLGRHFLEQGQEERAVYWYLQAFYAPRRDGRGGFVFPDAYGYIPAIQLCVCYSHLENYRAAWGWNQKAEELKPGDAAAAHNRAFLLTKLVSEGEGERTDFVQNRL